MRERFAASERSSAARRAILDRVAAQVPANEDESCVLVGIDGPDGSGKTIFANQLAATLREAGRPAVRISLDDFHNTREGRYRRGRESPIGFWLDSYNYQRFIADVLDPLGASGAGQYRAAAHDLVTDEILDLPWQQAPPRAVVVIDGLFLHRAELVDRWDFTVFLDVRFDITAARMALRDGTEADPDHVSMRRYVDAQRIYYCECSPKAKATVVIDNADPDSPEIELSGFDRGADPTDLTIDVYATEAEKYLANSAPLPPEVRLYLDDFAGLCEGDQVLELGSGPGWDADYLEQHGLTVQRTDASPAFVERLRAAGHDTRLLDARSDDYGGPFDAVLADAVLLHLSPEEAEAALRTARRAVGDAGVLGLTLKEGDGAAWSTAKLGRPRHFTYWRAPALTTALTRSGWSIHSLRQIDGRREPWIFVLARADDAAQPDE